MLAVSPFINKYIVSFLMGCCAPSSMWDSENGVPGDLLKESHCRASDSSLQIIFSVSIGGGKSVPRRRDRGSERYTAANEDKAHRFLANIGHLQSREAERKKICGCADLSIPRDTSPPMFWWGERVTHSSNFLHHDPINFSLTATSGPLKSTLSCPLIRFHLSPTVQLIIEVISARRHSFSVRGLFACRLARLEVDLLKQLLACSE
jgi:hypothetical protein